MALTRFTALSIARGVALLAAISVIGSCAGESGVDVGEDGEVVADPEDPCVPGPNPSLELGHGEGAFMPLEDGGTIELVHGPQGGFHTLMALNARDIDGSEELVGELRGYIGDEQRGASFPYLNFRCNGDEGLQVWGLFLIWEAQPEELHMQTVRVEVEVTDASGEVVTTSKEAVIYDPTFD